MPCPVCSRKGFTLVEMVLIVSLISLFSVLLIILVNPVQMRRKGRDVVRLVDLNNLLQALENYNVDYNNLPDLDNTARRSDQPLVPGMAPQLSDGRGWIGTDLSAYMAKLPTDPLNSWPYVYRYKKAGKKFEIDVVMEEYANLMENDGGNEAERYELGTDLELL